MIILYVILILILGAASFLAGAVWYATTADGSCVVKRFEEDGTYMCNVHLTLTADEFKKRKFITLRCMEGSGQRNAKA